MSVLHVGQTREIEALLIVTNFIFSFIFLMEAALKLIAYGGSYFSNSWNKFDFFVVVASGVDILMDSIGTTGF